MSASMRGASRGVEQTSSAAVYGRRWSLPVSARVYARFDCECACVRRLLRREICCFQHGETESNVWNTFVWSCPTWPSRWGMRISIDWPRLKSCQAVCDECMRGEIPGEIYSSLSRDAGCSVMWTWRSCASLKFGVQSTITDSCYFFSLPRVSI